MYTIYISKCDSWEYRGTFKTASEASQAARDYHNIGYKVEIDSSEVPVIREDY